MLNLNNINFFLTIVCLYLCVISRSCSSNVTLDNINKKFTGHVNGQQLIITRKHQKSLDKAFSTSYISIKSNHTCIIHEGISLVDIEKSGKDLVSSLLRLYSKFKTPGENVCDTSIFVSPFKDYYVQIEVNGPLEVEYDFIHVDFRLIVLCILAVILNFEAERISKNVTFYYASGMSIGLIGSALILLVVLLRFIPKKTTAAVAFLTGSSAFLFATRWFYYNFRVVIESFQVYIFAYMGLSVLISTLFLYYRGPINNPRTFKIIEFILKAISYLLFYCGMSYKELFISFVIAITLANLLIKLKTISLFKKLKYRFFPPTRRLLTEDEYIKEAHDFTMQSLKELNEYCHSPECNSWKVISRLKNPDRFAKFIMDEEPHINESEIIEHEKFSISSDLIDDDEDL